LRQHGMALRQIGDEARVGLAEADHGPALLLDVAHREAALAPVVPGGIGERRQHPLGLDVADAAQVVQQRALLGLDLLLLAQVLQHAAGAVAKVRAARLDPVRRGLQHLQGAGLVEMAVSAGALGPDPLARQPALDEHRLALGIAADAAAVMAQVMDIEFEDLVKLAAGTGHGTAWRNGPRIVAYPRPVSGKPAGPRPGRRLPLRGSYFCFQLPSAAWYHQPLRALATHCLAKVSRIWASHSGWLLATAISRYRALRSRLSSATAAFTATRSLSGSRPASRTTTRPSLPKPRAPLSKCGCRVPWKRCAMRSRIAWMAGVRMFSCSCDCACAVGISSDSGSKPRRAAGISRACGC